MHAIISATPESDKVKYQIGMFIYMQFYNSYKD